MSIWMWNRPRGQQVQRARDSFCFLAELPVTHADVDVSTVSRAAHFNKEITLLLDEYDDILRNKRDTLAAIGCREIKTIIASSARADLNLCIRLQDLAASNSEFANQLKLVSRA